MGAEHGADPARRTWAERRQDEAESSARTDAALRARHRRRPGRHRARRAAAPARRARPSSSTSTPARATSGATATSRCACTTRSGTTTCPTCKFPDNWPVFSPKDKIGDWLEFYTRVMEVPYWSEHDGDVRDLVDEAAGEWTVEVERDGEPLTLRPDAAGASRPACRASRTCPSSPGQDVFRGDQHHSSRAPGPRRVRRQAGRGDRLQQLRLRHLRRAVGERRRRDDGAALLDAHRASRDSADGHRPGRPLLRAGGGGRRDHREGRHDLRLAALPDHARVPDPGVRGDGASATRTSTSGWRRPASGTTGATTARGCS